ncbi:MAG: thioesterase [Oceanospirillaceae bacterium]|nr:thioesterase [Oceanospirillaceae bacterium]
MWKTQITPRFSETDAKGHINNNVVPVWFAAGREAIFRLFSPDMDFTRVDLIVARIEVDFKAEIHCRTDVEVRTFIRKLGNSSVQIGHELWQDQHKVAEGTAIMVHFDYQTKQSSPLPDGIRSALQQHLLESTESNAQQQGHPDQDIKAEGLSHQLS